MQRRRRCRAGRSRPGRVAAAASIFPGTRATTIDTGANAGSGLMRPDRAADRQHLKQQLTAFDFSKIHRRSAQDFATLANLHAHGLGIVDSEGPSESGHGEGEGCAVHVSAPEDGHDSQAERGIKKERVFRHTDRKPVECMSHRISGSPGRGGNRGRRHHSAPAAAPAPSASAAATAASASSRRARADRPAAPAIAPSISGSARLYARETRGQDSSRRQDSSTHRECSDRRRSTDDGAGRRTRTTGTAIRRARTSRASPKCSTTSRPAMTGSAI